jgi:hypothetical protein
MNAGATVLLYSFAGGLITHGVYWFVSGDYSAHSGLRNSVAVVQLLAGAAMIGWLALKARRSAAER